MPSFSWFLVDGCSDRIRLMACFRALFVQMCVELIRYLTRYGASLLSFDFLGHQEQEEKDLHTILWGDLISSRTVPFPLIKLFSSHLEKYAPNRFTCDKSQHRKLH